MNVPGSLVVYMPRITREMEKLPHIRTTPQRLTATEIWCVNRLHCKAQGYNKPDINKSPCNQSVFF